MYFVYQGDHQHVRTFNTEAEAVQWVQTQLKGWRISGAAGYPQYRVCFNGVRSIVLRNWPSRSFADPAAVQI